MSFDKTLVSLSVSINEIKLIGIHWTQLQNIINIVTLKNKLIQSNKTLIWLNMNKRPSLQTVISTTNAYAYTHTILVSISGVPIELWDIIQLYSLVFRTVFHITSPIWTTLLPQFLLSEKWLFNYWSSSRRRTLSQGMLAIVRYICSKHTLSLCLYYLHPLSMQPFAPMAIVRCIVGYRCEPGHNIVSMAHTIAFPHRIKWSTDGRRSHCSCSMRVNEQVTENFDG